MCRAPSFGQILGCQNPFAQFWGGVLILALSCLTVDGLEPWGCCESRSVTTARNKRSRRYCGNILPLLAYKQTSGLDMTWMTFEIVRTAGICTNSVAKKTLRGILVPGYYGTSKEKQWSFTLRNHINWRGEGSNSCVSYEIFIALHALFRGLRFYIASCTCNRVDSFPASRLLYIVLALFRAF